MDHWPLASVSAVVVVIGVAFPVVNPTEGGRQVQIGYLLVNSKDKWLIVQSASLALRSLKFIIIF